LDNEKAVNAALSNLAITRLVVAHRPETLRAAGRVVSMQDGVLVDVDLSDKSTQAKHHESA
jgi:ATP-binding cassette, subfamily B, bacterial CvaB/MchF/RaxB